MWTDAISRYGHECLDKIVEEILPNQAIPRVAEPEDVANVIGLALQQRRQMDHGKCVLADGSGIKIL